MTAKKLNNYKKFLAPVLTRATQVKVVRGRGSWLFDNHGQKYLDFTAGVAVASTGHCHPAVVAAVKKQAEKLIHGMAGIVYNEPNLKLAAKLAQIAPKGIDSFFFGQSGSEAVEGALKLVKYISGKPGIIAFGGGFHGRTLGALSVTSSKQKFRQGYEPLLPEIYFFPYPYCFRCPFGKKKYPAAAGKPACGKNGVIGCAGDLKKFFAGLKNKKIAGAIIEPILGEGGYTAAPREFLKLLRQLCAQNKIYLIFDEIQCGLGRTGQWWAGQLSGVTPDVICIAKGIASGLPLGVLGAPSKLMKKWPAGAHGGTYPGNPVTAAAGLATISIIEGEKLRDNAKKIGRRLFEKLNKLKKKYSFIGEVRGYGLMVAIEFVKFHNFSPTEIVKKIKEFCLQKKMLILSCSSDDAVIRLMPPLNVKKSEAALALKILEEAFNNLDP
jgi:4-aminobutyrate aminotransferase